MYMPSKVAPALYDALDSHVRKYDNSDIYDGKISEVIGDFFYNTVNGEKDENSLIPSPCEYSISVYLDPDTMGGCVTVAWVENGHLYQEQFDFSERIDLEDN